MSRRYSLRAVSLGDDLRTVAPMAQRLGFGAMQLDMHMGALALNELSLSGQREVRHIMAQYNLEADSVRLQLSPDALMDIGKHDRLIWAVGKAINSAVGLKIEVLCIDVGSLPVARDESASRGSAKPLNAGLIIIPETVPVSVEPAQPEDSTAWAGVDSVLREIASHADRAGIVLALSAELASFASIRRAIQNAACPNVGLDLDPVSVLRDQWNLERVLDAVGSFIRHVRIRDAVKGSGGRTQPAGVGRGSTDWPAMLTMLDAGAYSGWMTVDTVDLPNRAEEVSRTLSLLLKV